MDEEQYQKARKELEALEKADLNDPNVADNAEYIEHQKAKLKADIFAYQNSTNVAYNPYE